jgi:hypothetical protein
MSVARRILPLLCLAVVTLLSFCPSFAGQVTLRWTSPGDDGMSGQAAYYDIRYATFPLNASTWNLASVVPNPPMPQAPGQPQEKSIGGLLPTVEYFFAIKTADENYNWSAISNVAKRTVPVNEYNRGDVNLNAIPYEVGDVVTFVDYFSRGLAAFTIATAEQIAQTDVTVDGSALTVSDLTYLIRVVTGDAVPIARLDHSYNSLLVQTTVLEDRVRISSTTDQTIGAAYLIYRVGPGIEIGNPIRTASTDAMSVSCNRIEDQVHVLLYDFGRDRVSPGAHELLELPINRSGQFELISADFADYNGHALRVTENSGLPTEFSLSQNYPNPFNPTTRIDYFLPQSEHVELVVYNVAGQQVRQLANQRESAGPHSIFWDSRNTDGEGVASGVYFYRLRAGDFTTSRRMVLLK